MENPYKIHTIYHIMIYLIYIFQNSNKGRMVLVYVWHVLLPKRLGRFSRGLGHNLYQRVAGLHEEWGGGPYGRLNRV